MRTDFLPATTERVEAHTSDAVNRRIHDETEDSVAFFADHPEQIGRRLAELDEEWDIERTLEANAATLSLAGLALGAAVDRRFYALPLVVAGFLLQHALQGWCPPVPVFRRQGVRTAHEIEQERVALKYLRGDFAEPPPANGPARSRARIALAVAAR
ncbi:MAG: hypothetical protein WD270_06540 [Acetobacterales bacterium]